MKNIRIGNDINIVWSIFDVTGTPYELKKEMKLTLKCGNYLYEVENYTVEDNKIMFTFYGKTQTTVGTYMLTLVENDDEVGMQTVDCCKAFKLVRTSCEQTDDDTLNPQVDTLQLTSNIDFYGVMGGNTEPEFIEFADLIAKAERGELEVGKEYRYPYTLVVLDNDDEYFRYKSAGHYFDIVTRALTPSILCEKVRIMYNENDSYFKDWNANVGAWQVWINMQRPTQVDVCYMPSVEEFINTKGQIYKMIDENGIECNYDFKNLLFKCCVEAIFTDNDAETEFKATIPYNDAVNWGRETDPFYLYTFSTYIGEENWKDNIVDASLFDRKYSNDGFKTFDSIKINLYFADEGSICVIKVLSIMDDDGFVYNNEYLYDFNINNNGTSGNICCFGSMHNMNITDSNGVYLHSCNDCEIKHSICVLDDTNNSKIINSNYVGLGSCYDCEINNSEYIYVYNSPFNKFADVKGYGDALDYTQNLIIYIMESGDWSNINEIQNCDFKNVTLNSGYNCNNVKIHNVADELIYFDVYECYNIDVPNLQLDLDDIENTFTFLINDCNNMAFGHDNVLYITSIDCHISTCDNINIGNNNYITLYQGTESEDLYGFHNLANVTVGNNTGELFISHCANVNIGDNNDIRIVGRSNNINNITVMNRCELYLSDRTTKDKNIGINDIKLENDCALQLCNLDNYKCVNDYNGQSDISQIHIKNGGSINMLRNPQEQNDVKGIINIICDGSTIGDFGIKNKFLANISFINCNIEYIFFETTKDDLKNLAFKDCSVDTLYSGDITSGVLYTITIDSTDTATVNDFIYNNYPIQYVVNGRTFAMTEI